MRRLYHCVFLGLLITAPAWAEIGQERPIDEVAAPPAEPAIDLGGIEGIEDEEKFNAASERRQQRRDEALQKRREQNANKVHVYPIVRFFNVPGALGPFDLEIDINRGGPTVRGGGDGGGFSLPAVNPFSLQRPPVATTRVLFFQDRQTRAADNQTIHLTQNGLSVVAPDLPLEDVERSIAVAEALRERIRPDVIVGHSRGGALAMNMDSRDTPILLLAPKWESWGTATSAKSGTLILHSPKDSVVPIDASKRLLRQSGLPENALIETGQSHRLISPEALNDLLEACLRLAD